MNILVDMVFGSHLFGTDTPNSDTDKKGIYLPSKEEVFLGKIPKLLTLSKGHDNEKNTHTDLDHEIYSLHYFLKLACEGQTVALDMLHSSPKHWVTKTETWIELWSKREWFYTKNLSAFVGYARTQAAKYGIKGSRLDAAKRAKDHLMTFQDGKMQSIWETLWEDEYCKKIFNGTHHIWQVCGRGLSETSWISHAVEILNLFINNYGERARKAEANEGIDWKAISHALRAGYEARAILKHGGFEFPLPEVDFLREVKAGQHDYLTVASPALESLMEELEGLREVSTLPEKVDRHMIDAWLMDVLTCEFSP